MRALDAFKKGLGAVLRWFCIILFAVLVLLVCWQVFVRQVLHGGDPWTEVAARIVFVWQGLIGAAYVIGEKDDVAIDFLVSKLPTVGVKTVTALANAVVAFFAGWVMVYGGSKIVAAGWDDTVQLLPVTQGQVYLVIPIAGVLILIFSIIHIIEAYAKPVKVVDPNTLDITELAEESI